MICYFMLSGKLPFPGKNDDEKEARILRGSVSFSGSAWAQVSDDGKDLIKKLLVSDERKRLTGRKALQHPWITNRAKLSDQPSSKEVAESIKRYADAHRFEKAVRHSMATHLTSSELHKLRNTFEHLDSDGVGTISIDRLKEVRASCSACSFDDPHQIVLHMHARAPRTFPCPSLCRFVAPRPKPISVTVVAPVHRP